MDCGFLNGPGRLLVTLGLSVDKWALGECEIFREPGWISVGLWGPL